MGYPFQLIEEKWQSTWDREKTFRTRATGGAPKAYVLDMFPYPSGAGLHVGHPEGYTATDIFCRFLRMRGVDVLHPMGWDAFGLPAERYAMQTNIHPRDDHRQNIATFRRQIKMLGLSYDWEREVDTTDPAYYHWTQWIFLQIYNSWYRPAVPQGSPVADAGRGVRAERFVRTASGGGISRRQSGRPGAAVNSRRSSPGSASPTWPRSRSIGVRSWGPCWPTRRFRSGRKRDTPSSAGRCASG